MSRSLGIPVKLLHEASGHVVTVELKSGELYRGSMVECEDNWNCQLENITYTAKDGKVSQLEHVFIRGSKVRFMVIPDMLKNAPMFKRLEARIKGKGSALGVGRGRAVAMRARVSYPALPLSFLMAQSDIYCPKMVWQLGAGAVFSL
ncbi:small nuclear ribonucleo 3b-like [Olea europaea subsp. europaea]|uniref:Small nuclear ribonucleoprotein Sm D3 n=1 Tax=Olea europaea subsp. europaea TaxID=158383 RepID=A0A8S0TL99_OLEEU|nr:small nuclear ribonucleo 3b-like [Olea europaea subsp. europaea]